VTKASDLGSSTNCAAVTTTDNTGLEPYQVDYTYDPIGRITSRLGPTAVERTAWPERS
jgi:hypothetical protein